MPTIPEVILYDSINADSIPSTAEAVAGYVDGKWATWSRIMRRFPRARHVSITVTGGSAADCCDVEKGDLSVASGVRWVERMHAEGHAAPGIYADLDAWPELLHALSSAGIHRAQYRVWTAHWTGHPHRCGDACDAEFTTVADATQFVSSPMGRAWDLSIAQTTFFTSHSLGGSPAGR